MEIVRSIGTDGVELTIEGRLDSYWAEHLDRGLAETVQDGHDRLRLDLSRVTFLSSAGIGVLMKYFKQLREIDGELVVCSPSLPVQAVLDMTRLAALLVEAPDRTAARVASRVEGARMERDGMRLELFDLADGAVLRGGPLGGVNAAAPSPAAVDRSTPLRCPDSLYAIGVGALGASFNDCRDRFGEFLAVGGAAAYLPGDGTHVPDYLVAAGAEAPELQVLNGIAGRGAFARQLRFDPIEERALGLADLAAWCLELSDSNVAGLVTVAEAAGLVGAALRRSPASRADNGDWFAYPAVRNHLSFTAEHAFVRTTVVAAGFVARDPLPELRPLGGKRDLYGHFHAAAFTFAPLKKGRLALKALVAHVFEHQSLLGVLHLLHDDRPAGAGESALIRGACWFGPMDWERE
jgi:anti-anti-sigma factor